MQVEALRSECPHLPRVVWKTDLHGTPKALDLLNGVVDVYLADFKFGNDACARRLAGVERYVEILERNLRSVFERGDLIVRHLLLQGHWDCCFRPWTLWLSRHLPQARLSIRDGYLPHWQAEHYEELSRPLPARYADRARGFAHEAGLQLID